MAGLPYSTHRYLMEPLSGQSHMSIVVVKNFLSFITRIRESPKPVLRQLYQMTKNNVQSTTGRNLRNILVQTNLSKVDDLTPSVVGQISYKPINDNDQWRVNIIKEIMDIKSGLIETPLDWTYTEIDEILNIACSQ